MFILKCVKCKEDYESEDEDPYFCLNCLSVKQRIAAEIDAKFANRSTIKPKTPLELYDELPKTRGFPNAANFMP